MGTIQSLGWMANREYQIQCEDMWSVGPEDPEVHDPKSYIHYVAHDFNWNNDSRLQNDLPEQQLDANRLGKSTPCEDSADLRIYIISINCTILKNLRDQKIVSDSGCRKIKIHQTTVAPNVGQLDTRSAWIKDFLGNGRFMAQRIRFQSKKQQDTRIQWGIP